MNSVPARSLIIGGTGFVGRYLVRQLEKPVVAGRDMTKIRQIFGRDIDAVELDPCNISPTLFEGVEVVYNLAGESIFRGRWNRTKKQRIRDSRVEFTRNLVQAMSRLDTPPSTFISSSAIGYYGDCGDRTLREDDAPGGDFLALVCRDWEREARNAEKHGSRTVCIRTGVVLGRDGGALQQMLTPFRLGLGGPLGPGTQYMAWIHIHDLVGIMRYAADSPDINGPVNGVAPSPVTSADFAKALGRVLKRPARLPLPSSVMRLLLGEFAEVLLASQRVIPEKILASGYSFRYPEIEKALQDLLK